MTGLRVVGADLSLAGSALATTTAVHQLTTRGRKGDSYTDRLHRLRTVRRWVCDTLDALAPDLVVLEAPAPNAVQRVSVWDRAHLWWEVVDRLTEASVAVAYAPPPNVKKYATGNGHADKKLVLAAGRQAFPHQPLRNDNDADALWLCAMGHAWLGAPLLSLPPAHTRSLAGVAWPRRDLFATTTSTGSTAASTAA